MEENEESLEGVMIEIEIVPREKMIYISEENSSGCKYPYDSLDEAGQIFQEYINDYVKNRTTSNEQDEELEN